MAMAMKLMLTMKLMMIKRTRRMMMKQIQVWLSQKGEKRLKNHWDNFLPTRYYHCRVSLVQTCITVDMLI